MPIGIIKSFFETLPLMALIVAVPAFIAWRSTRSLPYVVCVALFGVYLLEVVQVALIPMEISGSYTDTMRAADLWGANINLIPFYFGPFTHDVADVFDTMALNALLTIPFGFGVSFVARVRRWDFLWLGLAVGVGIEGAQLAISLLLGYPYRIIDVNDVIMNWLGVVIGYGVFRAFAWGAGRIGWRLWWMSPPEDEA